MEFSEKDVERIEQLTITIRDRLSEIQKDPEWVLSLSFDESPHVWQRLDILKKMSDDEIRAENEADYALFVKSSNEEKGLENLSLEMYSECDESQFIDNVCSWVRGRVCLILNDPMGTLSLKSDEFPHIWRRLEMFAAMRAEELRSYIDADNVLFTRHLFRKCLSRKELEPLLEKLLREQQNPV